jgi:hypothetical protein
MVRRNVAGLLVLVCTLVGMLAINRASQQAVGGSAGRPPSPPAPQSGTCLVLETTGWVPSDCGEPHTAEVALGWSADQLRSVNLSQACANATESYVSVKNAPATTGSSWAVPSVMLTAPIVSGPDLSPTAGWSWRACVIRPVLPTLSAVGYRGRVRDSQITGVLPLALRPCYDRPPGLGLISISCTTEHLGEVLATRQLQIFGSDLKVQTTATEPAVLRECLDVARKSTGSSDPTYGGKLSVVVNLRDIGIRFVVSAASEQENADSYVRYRASCSLEAAQGRSLYASVVGVGSGPAPLR